MVKFNSALWDEWVVICNKYLREFCEKHDYDFDDATNSWVANFDGTICLCGDEYISMEDIIADIEMKAPEEEFRNWYFYCLDAHQYGEFAPNYYSWLNGCPRLTIDEMKKHKKQTDTIKKIKNKPVSEKLTSLKKELNNLIDEYINKGGN